MGVFVKVQKDKAYFKRYQVKYRRRREGKTDYYQRKKLCIQAKNKYASPKYRLVVRKTNTTIICQVVYATIVGDKVLASAYSTELPRYGLEVGLKNYAAAYCTGLLVGRRVLQKLGLDEKYTGVGNDEEDEIDGEIMSIEFNKRKYFVDEMDEDRRPLRVNLDIGLARTSLGAKIFGALKGAADSGLDIPHNPKKFPGYDKDEKTYDADTHKEQIFGEPVAEYMRFLEQEDEESGTKTLEEKFKTYVEKGVNADDLEELYLKVHKAIRADPSSKHKENKATRNKSASHNKEYKRPARKTLEERKAAVEEKLAKIEAMEEGESESESEEDDE